MMRRRILTMFAVGAMVALPLAACADDDDADGTTTTADTTTTTTQVEVDEAVLQRVTDASQATIDEGTASFTIEAHQETDDATDGTTTTTTTTTTTNGAGTADDDATTTTGRGTNTDTDTERRESEVDIEGVVDFDNDQRRLTFVGPEGELDMILDGSEAYIELPATEDDDWARIDLEALLDTQVGVGGPAALPFQDPADNLRVLQGNVISATEEGTEQIDGEDTDHFRLVIDLEASVSDAPEDVQEALEETLARTGAQELEMEVWIDEDDLIRQARYTLDLDQIRVDEEDVDNGTDTGVAADPEGRLVVTFTYFDFGEDVEIELPDEENIVDIDEDAIRRSLGLDEGTGTTGTTTTTTNGTGTGGTDDTTTTTAVGTGGADDTTTTRGS
jgi:hypothetical protein